MPKFTEIVDSKSKIISTDASAPAQVLRKSKSPNEKVAKASASISNLSTTR